MYVACSTLCFSRQPLPLALAAIAELGFSKVEVAIHERGPHLRPSEVTGDLHALAQQLRAGPGLLPAAFDVAIDNSDAEKYQERLRSVCQLARVAAVSLITLSAAPAGTSLEAEALRCKKLVAIGEKEGVIIALATRIGTLTEDPDAAAQLFHYVILPSRRAKGDIGRRTTRMRMAAEGGTWLAGCGPPCSAAGGREGCRGATP